MQSLVYLLAVLLACSIGHVSGAALPDKVYGVNLGSWLIVESWMQPQEWHNMGGETCTGTCSGCISTEYALTQANPSTADATFAKHWSTWFNQTDVDKLSAAGINTVRIPIGYWILEALVDRTSEYYPRGGISYLRNGLKMLKAAGITAILDHHGLPGVQSPNQMSTGRCTTDVQFYTTSNYRRALTWSAVMTALSHLDPVFGSVAAIEAANEPIANASLTPGYGDFQKDFVRVVRAVELIIGVPVPNTTLAQSISTTNLTLALTEVSSANGAVFTDMVVSALKAASPILQGLATQFSLDSVTNFNKATTKTMSPLVASFMSVRWQYNNPPNPVNAAIGPQAYDSHVYYSASKADPTESAYLTSICNTAIFTTAASVKNDPLVVGEWALLTGFHATDAFLVKWADAQKLAYNQGRGWIFWNFKIENSSLASGVLREWSYLGGLERGYFTKDPSKLNDSTVCDSYVNTTAAKARTLSHRASGHRLVL
ncbi:glycoside hydrolase family 5 protein [Plicaturopsis crispa FD-325 SS-3]|nr:glycoside hydrolase family 5 protein [Plicaturopsis crispa FD-325 SS-3]